MPELYTYVITVDTGFAPNPYWGALTLATCKPRIRTSAEIGDWVVATGSANSPIGDIRDRVVYAMQITDKMLLEEYDDFTRSYLPEKIPDLRHNDPRRWVGDSVYDFDTMPPRVRPAQHNHTHRTHDLSGRFVLLSQNFWYFGKTALRLPPHLLDIIKPGPGHRSGSNRPYVATFKNWLDGWGLEPNHLYGEPLNDWDPRDRANECAPLPLSSCAPRTRKRLRPGKPPRVKRTKC